MNSVVAKEIAASLRLRGFDARLYEEPAGHGARHYRGIAVHGVRVLGWRYPDGRWQFTDRPPRLIEPEPTDPAGRWIWDDIFNDVGHASGRGLPVASASEAAHLITQRVAEFLPANPNCPRAQSFPDFWSWDQACLDSVEAPVQWYRDWSDHLFAELRPEAARAGYTPDTARLADVMCSPRALTPTPHALAGPHDQPTYRLASDAPLAKPLRDRLRNICIRTDFSTWAQIGSTSDRVDWHALVDELSPYLGWECGRDAAASHTSDPGEVCLRVGPDGRILIRPNAPDTTGLSQ